VTSILREHTRAGDSTQRAADPSPRASKSHAEDQEVLIREEVVLLEEPVARGPELCADDVGGDLVLGRRPTLGVEPEVDDREASARTQPLAQSREVGRAIGDVVVRVDDEHEIDRLAQARIRLGRLAREQVREPLTLGAIREVADHRGLDVEREHAALGHGPREAQGGLTPKLGHDAYRLLAVPDREGLPDG